MSPHETILTPELCEALVASRSTSLLHDSQIAMLHGVSRFELDRWLVAGLSGESDPLTEGFARSYLSAGIALESRLADEASGAGAAQRGAAWALERCWPQRWGPGGVSRPDQVDVRDLLERAGQRTATIEELLDDPTPELIAMLRARRGAILRLLQPEPRPPVPLIIPPR